jgi:hypothetical protein
LTSIITQERNNGGEKQHHDKIDGTGYLGLWITPEDEYDFKNEKKDGKLNLFLHKEGELQSVIDPPGEKPCGDGEGRGNRSQNKEVDTGDLKGRIFEEEIKKDKEGRGHQKGDGKMDDHGMGMASCHGEPLKKVLKRSGKVFQFLRCPFFQNPYLGISLKNLCLMRSCGEVSCQIFACGMPVHMKALGPKRAFGHVIDLLLKSNIDGFTILSVKG